jgi:predicted dehydrogenase
MIRIGVIGCGYWGPNLVRNFVKNRDCELDIVADLQPERLDSLGRLYPAVKRTGDAMEVLGDPTLDAVAIATPVATHFDLAREALQNGKHVLVTKPMTRTVAEAEKLVELADKTGRVLLVDHTFIFSGPVRKIRELISAGQIGDIYYYDSVRVNLGLFQPDVNVLWDLACHDLYIMSYLMDKKPVGVWALGTQPLPHSNLQFESLAYIFVRFQDRTIGHVHVSWLSPVKIRRTILGGSNKMVVYDHLDPDNQVKLFDKGVEVHSSEEAYKARVQYRMGDMHAPKVDQKEALEVECAHFVDCIRHGTAAISGAQSGLQSVRLLEAADRSMRAGGVEIPL